MALLTASLCVGSFMMAVALILHLVGLASPNWLVSVIDYEVPSSHGGLYRMGLFQYCRPPLGCSDFPEIMYKNYSYVEIAFTQGLMITGMMSGMMALGLTIACCVHARLSKDISKTLKIIMILASSVTPFFIFAAEAIFFLKTHYEYMDIDILGYSPFLCTLAALMFPISGLIAFCGMPNSRSPPADSEQSPHPSSTSYPSAINDSASSSPDRKPSQTSNIPDADNANPGDVPSYTNDAGDGMSTHGVLQNDMTARGHDTRQSQMSHGPRQHELPTNIAPRGHDTRQSQMSHGPRQHEFPTNNIAPRGHDARSNVPSHHVMQSDLTPRGHDTRQSIVSHAPSHYATRYDEPDASMTPLHSYAPNYGANTHTVQ